MNLSAVSVFNVQKNYKASKNNVVKNKVSNNLTNSIQNNSLQEAIGRSQVSFQGTMKNNISQIEYVQSNMIGSSEEIKYDKTTGQFEFVESYPNGTFKKILRISPISGEEYERNYDKEGGSTISTKFKNGDRRIEKFNQYQDLLYFEYIYADNSRVVEEHDHTEERIIRTTYDSNRQITDIHVLDLTSRTDVPRNDRRNVASKVYENANGTRDEVEYNIVTGFEYSRKTFKGNNLIKGFVRHKDTQAYIWIARTEKGKFIEEHLTDFGVLKERTTTNSNRTEVIEETFDYTGDNLTSKIKKTYGVLGGLKSIQDINVKTGYPNKITTMNKNGKTVDTYNPKSGLKTQTSTFDNNEVEKTRTNYYKDTETPEEFIEYLNCKSSKHPHCDKRITEFNTKGVQQTVNYFNPNGDIYKIEFLDKTGKYIDVIRNYNLSNDTYTDTSYFENGRPSKISVCDLSDMPISVTSYWESTGEKKLEKIYYDNGDYSKTFFTKDGIRKAEVICSEDGFKLEETEFYEDGNCPRNKRVYNDDCSYHEINYTVNGSIESEGDFYADGTPKMKYRRTTNDNRKTGGFYDWSQDAGFNAKKKQAEISIDEVIDKVSHTVSYGSEFSRLDLDEKYWEAFAAFLEFASVSDMLKMDNAAYRKLGMKYHPDKHPEATPQEQIFYSKVFSIVNAIRERAKKNGIK